MSDTTILINQHDYMRQRGVRPAMLLLLEPGMPPKPILLGNHVSIGRQVDNSAADLQIKSCIVSKAHGEIFLQPMDHSYYYVDTKSLNGTFINGEKLPITTPRGSVPLRLTDGDIIRIDRSTLDVPHPEAVLMLFTTSLDPNAQWNMMPIGQQNMITIGRSASNMLRLDDFMVSGEHAKLVRNGADWFIFDCDSTNGVILNGKPLTQPMKLNKYDVIRICDTIIIFEGDLLYFNAVRQNNCSMVVDIKTRSVNFGKRILLKDIHAEFEGGDFVLILGGSGAGKTTLIKSMLGEDRADGKIVLDGIDLYKNFKSVKSRIGKVPQMLTLRKNDTLRHTLIDTAQMKLGGKYSNAEILERVDSVLDHVGITEHQYKLIGQLSGGQQKKAAVANQLVGFQKVFICDEPDSGLDAASRMQQMEILKDISKENKIVMVISHQPDDAVSVDANGNRTPLFTKVLVLARSSTDAAGHLAYFGRIEDVYGYFGVQRLQDIMLEINPASEGGKGLADMYINKFNALSGR
ncbi:MAG: FHA domain-containing protein [Oscillospiraceae bacterium]